MRGTVLVSAQDLSPAKHRGASGNDSGCSASIRHAMGAGTESGGGAAMEAHLIRIPMGFIAASEHDRELIAGIKHWETVRCTIRRARNGMHHRKMFALLQIVLDNSDQYANIDDLLVEIKLQVGHYREHVTLNGELVLVPKSIAFSAMDQDTFDVFYRRVVDVVINKLLIGLDENELERQVSELAGFF